MLPSIQKEKLGGCNRRGQIARPMTIGRARACKISEKLLIFRERTFCLVENKKPLYLQVFSPIGKK